MEKVVKTKSEAESAQKEVKKNSPKKVYRDVYELTSADEAFIREKPFSISAKTLGADQYTWCTKEEAREIFEHFEEFAAEARPSLTLEHKEDKKKVVFEDTEA